MNRKESIAAAVAKNDDKKQQNAIIQLERDNEKLVQELALESKQNSMLNNTSASAEIKRLQDQGDQYTKRIELERRRIAELEKQISIVQKKLDAQRKVMGGVHVSKQNNLVLSKQIRVLENRLDKAVVRYNEILGKNKLLKDKIDDLRKERLIFDGIYKKLEKEMQTEKKEMAKLVDECNRAYKERDQAKQEIAKLKRIADEEQQEFQAEWKRLGELIENDKRAKEMGEMPEPDPNHLNSVLANEDDGQLKKKKLKGAWSLGKDKVQIQLSQEKAQNYEELFAKIQAEAGVSDIDELVTRFVEAEEKNYSLFNHVNELNLDIEKLEKQISGVDVEIAKYKGQGANSENQRKKILYELEQQLEQTSERTGAYEEKYTNSQKVLNELKTGIEMMFTKLGANQSEAALDMLGNDGVTDANIMQYLGIIEQRANEIIQLFSISQAGKEEVLQNVISSAGLDDPTSPNSPPGEKSEEPTSPDPKKPQYPSIKDLEQQEDLNEELFEDEVDRPLTRVELEANLNKKMQNVSKKEE